MVKPGNDMIRSVVFPVRALGAIQAPLRLLPNAFADTVDGGCVGQEITEREHYDEILALDWK